MKKTLTTLLLIGTVGLMSAGLISCRKEKTEPTIKEYDDEQIQNYIKANNLTGYQRDLSGGDTTGMYYKITRQGTGKVLDYPDKVFFVFTIKSLDGVYQITDTVVNHAYNYVGHVTPNGLMLAIKNIFKNNGTQGHVLVPSRLAFGTNGSGTGSGRLGGNESLDYYINIIDPSNQAAYDDMVIQNYIKANGLTGYTKTASGLYYKITQQGNGTNNVTENSLIGIQFTGKLMNNTIFDQYNAADTTATVVDYQTIPKGWQEGFKLVTKGAKLSLIIPSGLLYGPVSPSFSDASLPSNGCAYYDFNIESVTSY